MSTSLDFSVIKNPNIKKKMQDVFDTSSGHYHDGTDSRAVTVGTVSDLAVTNAKLAADVKVGSLATLTTTEVASVVGAINELDAENGNVGGLTTTATNLAGAVNELDANIGDKSTLTTSAKSSLVAAVNELDNDMAGAATKTGVETLTNKTLTTPVIASMYQDAGKTQLMTVPNSASDTLAAIAATQTLTNKTLTTPVIPSIYQDAGKTQLMSLPNSASDTLVALAASQVLTNKVLTSPSITHAIEAAITLAAGDVTLDATQKVKSILEVTTGHAANAIIAPAENRVYLVINNDASNNVLIKKSAGIAVTIPPSTSAVVYYNGTNYIMAACNEVTLAGTNTLTNKTLTSPKISQYTASHDYSGAAADWTLSASELKAQIIVATNANAAVNAIFNAATPNFYFVYNNTGYILTCKNAAGTTIAIPNGKRVFIYDDGVSIVALDNFISPLLTTPKIDDGDAGLTITSSNQTNASATATVPDIGDAADEFVMKDTAQTLTLKTLTTPVVASFYQDAGKTKLLTIPDTASDTLTANAATQTLTNKTLTAPVINTPVVSGLIISDGHENLTIASANQTDSGATATVPDFGDSADNFVMQDVVQTLTNKTLTTPVVASFYQDAGKTKLMTVPDTASDTLVAVAATQTLTGKRLTSPKINEDVVLTATATQLNEAGDKASSACRLYNLGAPILADDNRIVTVTDMKNGTYTIAASPDIPRNLTVTLTDVDGSDTVGILTVAGTNYADAAISEVITPVANSAVAGVKAFKTVTSITGSGWTTSGGADQIIIGVGNELGLPIALDATSEIILGILGVTITAHNPTVNAGAATIEETTIDMSAGTYDGAKAALVFVVD